MQSPSTGKKRSRLACSQCRQAKVRCGLEHVPCPRCRRLSLECAVDSSFKRSSKKDKVKDLEQQVQNLHQFISHQQNVLPSTQQISSRGSSLNARSSYHSGAIGHSASPHGSSNQVNIAPKPAEAGIGSDYEQSAELRVLGGTRITGRQAKDMFAVYFRHYHRFLPILEPNRSEDSYYDTSELLFWSVIAVSIRQVRSEADMLNQLALEVNELLWKTIATNPLTLALVQAILLLSYWPLPNVHLWTDKSWILSSLAMNSAMQLGMHRPDCEIAYSKDPTHLNRAVVAERTRAWIASVAQCQSLSIDLGHGSTPNFDDWTIRSVCDGSSVSDIPTELSHSLMVHKCYHDAFDLLSKQSQGPYGLPTGQNSFDLIWSCERMFDNLLVELDGNISLTNRLYLQSCRLHIQCLYFLYDQYHDLRLPGLLRAYGTASDIINTILSDDTSHDLLPYAPLRVVRIIFNAALVIFRILHSTSGAGLDYNNGRLLFNAAAFSMRQLSVVQKDKDQPIRASEMLRAFWRAATRSPTMSTQDLRLRVKSRMGASLAYDCLLLFRNKTTNYNGTDSEAISNGAGQGAIGVTSQNTALSGANELSNSGYMTTLEPAELDLSAFQTEAMSISPNIDITDTFWLEDIGYPAFSDAHMWQ